MRLRSFSILLLAAAFLAGACDGDEPAPPSTAAAGDETAVPTATPFAQLPAAVVVSGDGLPSGGRSAESAATYVVESGDTVGGIAERFGVSLDVIREANDLEGDDIFVGQTLTIPRNGGDSGGAASPGGTPEAGTAPDPAPDATETPAGVSGERPPLSGETQTYVIAEGDTAFGLALEFDLTVEELEAANGVGPGGLDNLSIGQEIVIPRR